MRFSVAVPCFQFQIGGPTCYKLTFKRCRDQRKLSRARESDVPCSRKVPRFRQQHTGGRALITVGVLQAIDNFCSPNTLLPKYFLLPINN